MRRHFAILFAALALAPMSPAQASEIVLHFNNMSGKSIVGMFATPKGETTVSEANLLQSGEVSPATLGEVTIASTEPLCVFDLKIQFGDGSTLDRPDVDLCQTDELVVE